MRQLQALLFASLVTISNASIAFAQRCENNFNSPVSTDRAWVTERAKGCRIYVPANQQLVSNQNISFLWSGTCVSGMADGPGKLEYRLSGFPIFSLEFSAQAGAIYKDGKPIPTFSPTSIQVNVDKCEYYIGGGFSGRNVSANVSNEIDLSNPLIAALVAAHAEGIAESHCPAKEIWGKDISLKRNGTVLVCAQNPKKYLAQDTLHPTQGYVQVAAATRQFAVGIERHNAAVKAQQEAEQNRRLAVEEATRKAEAEAKEKPRLALLTECGPSPTISGGPWFSSTYKTGALDQVARITPPGSAGSMGHRLLCVKVVEYIGPAVNPMGGNAARARFIGYEYYVEKNYPAVSVVIDFPY